MNIKSTAIVFTALGSGLFVGLKSLPMELMIPIAIAAGLFSVCGLRLVRIS